MEKYALQLQPGRLPAPGSLSGGPTRSGRRYLGRKAGEPDAGGQISVAGGPDADHGRAGGRRCETGPTGAPRGGSSRRNLTPDRALLARHPGRRGTRAVVRFLYLFRAAPVWVGGDGFDYHLGAPARRRSRLHRGDGRGPAEYAHHPPGVGDGPGGGHRARGRSMRAHQVVGLVIGLGVIVVAGLVGRRYAGRRVGVVAAFSPPPVPGLLGHRRPDPVRAARPARAGRADAGARGSVGATNPGRALLAGGLLGGLTLVRGEELALLAIAVAPILLLNRRLDVKRRFVFMGAAVLVVAVVVAPWAIHNLGRFEEPVLLSTNGGSTLLAGNCPPDTYGGEFIGSFDTVCNFQVSAGTSGSTRRSWTSRPARPRSTTCATTSAASRDRARPLRATPRGVPPGPDRPDRRRLVGDCEVARLGVGHVVLAPGAVGGRRQRPPPAIPPLPVAARRPGGHRRGGRDRDVR